MIINKDGMGTGGGSLSFLSYEARTPEKGLLPLFGPI